VNYSILYTFYSVNVYVLTPPPHPHPPKKRLMQDLLTH